MKDYIVFNLKQFWTYPDERTVDLYLEIKERRKTSEWRDATPHWFNLLFGDKAAIAMARTRNGIRDLTSLLRTRNARFMVGYPKNSLPRIEAHIAKVFFHPLGKQFQIVIMNATEVLSNV